MRAAAMQQLQATEAEIQRSIIQYLTMKNWYVLRLNSGMQVITQPGQARRAIHSTAAGTPDLLALRHDHAPLFIEVKRPGKKATPVQQVMMGVLIDHGATCMVATSVEDVQDEGI